VVPVAKAIEIDRRYELAIGGTAVVPSGGVYKETRNPATGEVLAAVPEAGAEDIDRAVAAAAEAAVEWGSVPWAGRAAAINALADEVEAEAENLAWLDVVDAGIPIRGMRRDVKNAVTYLRYFAALASELKGHSLEAPAGVTHLTVREPFGVVGRIIPFNHPVQFAAAAVAAPLAAGNTVVLKPAEQTPLSALHFAQLADRVLPAGAVNVVTGGAAVGSALVKHPAVRRIGFTGSVATGRRVLKDAADQIKLVTLELGGKNPLVVFPDVSPPDAADLVLIGMNLQRTAGQSCGSTSRVYVHASIHDAVVDALVDRFEELTVGDPTDEATDVGPLAFSAHRDRVIGLIRAGVEEGARLRCGGTDSIEGLESGAYVRPTIFDRVEDHMRIAQEEIFGPVVSVLRWRDEADVIARVNASPLGLTANIATNDLSAAMRMSREVQAGFVWVNGRGERPFGAPFGGYKHSGLGEENSLGELLSYTQTKSILLSGLK
jgi:betaine-aldehyde dehydrogenase